MFSLTPHLRKFVTQPYHRVPQNDSDRAAYPKLTVVTPSFNQVEYLERTILSVLNQQYPNLEYFIIDGGSTDGSVELIKQYEPYLSGWVSEKDRGQADAINKGFQRATGDYVAFQNSDDVYAPGSFTQVARAWRETPNVDVFFGNLCIIDEQDVILEEMRTLPFCAECQVHEGMQVFGQSLFIRRALLQQTGFLDESLQFVIDYELVTRLGIQPGVRFRQLPQFWGGFRVQPDAKTSTIGHVGLAEHEQIKHKYSPLLSSRVNGRIWRLYCRFRKLTGFVIQSEWGYIRHRYQLSRARK